MDLKNIRNIQKRARAAIEDARKPRRATGPTSVEGKTISAMNAAKHGLAGEHNVLPGESVEERERRVGEDMIALGVTNEPEAHLSALVTDGLEKLDRARRIELALMLGEIENVVAQTEAGERASRTAQALQTFGNACRNLLREPVPAERGQELQRRVDEMQAAVSFVPNTIEDTPMGLVATCHRHLTALVDQAAHPEFPAASFAALLQSAQQLMDWLVERARRAEAEQEGLRKAMSSIALPPEAELKRLARYVKLTEESLARRLAALEQVRKVTAGVSPTMQEQARAFRLRLRVVT